MADVPLVSVVVPTHNRAELLARSLRSVAEQDYSRLEVVVVDDASTDETPAVVERFTRSLGAKGVSVRSLRLEVNAGPAAARNRGVAAAEGSLLTFLDSDDMLEKTFVSTVAGLLERYPQCILAFCGTWKIDADDKKLGPLEPAPPGDAPEGVLHAPFDRLAQRELFQTSGVVLRREAFEDAGGFDETLRYSEDTDLWWRLAKSADFAYTAHRLVCHRLHPHNVTKNEEALVDSIRVHLRHLADVRDPVSRAAHLGRIQRRQILLQEKLLREPDPDGSYAALLDATAGSPSLRYRLSRGVARGPAWLRRAYLAGIQTTRATRRILTGAGPADFSGTP